MIVSNAYDFLPQIFIDLDVLFVFVFKLMNARSFFKPLLFIITSL